MRTAAATMPAAHSTSRAPATAAVRFAKDDDIELRVDLSDLTLPEVNNLHVDGLKKSWWSRLFGK